MSEANPLALPTEADVVIVGGGLAGLITAFRIKQYAPDVRLVILEATERIGGKAWTERVEHEAGSFIVEAGPDSLVTQKPHGLQLVRDLGLADHLLPICSISPSVSVLKRGQLRPLPEGMFLLAPTSARAFARTRLLSPAGKARVALEIVQPPRRDDEDESLAEFVDRRFGREALDWLAEPLMAGIYNADPERLSLLATFPMFRQLEREHRSVIRGLRKQRRPSGAARPAAFMTLRNGMGDIARELGRRLADSVVVGARVAAIAQSDGGIAVRVANGRSVVARVIVVAAPAASAAEMLAGLAPDVATKLRSLRSVDTGTVTLAYRDADVLRRPRGYGVVVPRLEQRPINAVTVSSVKFPCRAPEGWTLLRVFFGGTRSPETLDLDDASLLSLVQEELRDLFEVRGEPAFHRIYRWRSGSPQYDVGHLQRVSEIEQGLPPNILVTGSAYRGVGIPDIALQAEQTAQSAVAALRSSGGANLA